MKKQIWLVIILAIIIVVLSGVLIFLPGKDHQPNLITGTQGLTIFSLVANQEISSPIKITGVINGNGWAGFEGQVGTVKLLDSTGRELTTGILTATTEWTTLPTNFETTLSFQSSAAQSATIIFHNENPSGDPSRDKIFVLPVKIK